MSQNAALPAAVAIPTPEGPPLTSFVTSTRFGMAGQRLDPAQFRLSEERMIGQPLILQQGLHGAGAAAEPERIDG